MKKNTSEAYISALKKLTVAEVKILEKVEWGYTNKEIAEELNISIRTVHTHRNNICKKINVHGQGGLAKWLLKVRKPKN